MTPAFSLTSSSSTNKAEAIIEPVYESVSSWSAFAAGLKVPDSVATDYGRAIVGEPSFKQLVAGRHAESRSFTS